MAYFEDMTQTEIGEALGVPLGTVKSRTHRAQKRLAGLLAHPRIRPGRKPSPRVARSLGGGAQAEPVPRPVKISEKAPCVLSVDHLLPWAAVRRPGSP